MADALISIALEKLTEVAGQLLFADATSELRKISSTFHSIQALLDDVESRQVSDKNVKLWLSRLKHVAYDIEDLLEDGRISGLAGEEGNEDDGNPRKRARWSFPWPFNPWDRKRKEIARDIKEIREKLDDIADEKNKYGFSSSSSRDGDQRKLVRGRLPTTSLMDKSEMIIGRQHDKELMISRLVSGSSQEDGGQAHVVAMFGIGGLGKTTLAREIYNDHSVQDYFNGGLYWVCVSEVFDVIRLTEAILQQVKRTVNSPSKPDTLQMELLEALRGKPSDLDTIQKQLLKALRGKRFLLVLDDVWNDDVEKWKMLRLPLNSGSQGSRILVTTRGRKVARTMDATYIHELKVLSEDDSWEVFRGRAFVERTQEECSKLENVGRRIVSKCKGVPLAITVMGSAMSSKRTIADWQNILDSKMWSLRDAEYKILPALWLSYCNLPSQLKQCFTYCSMFPKDWEMEKDMLVRLWAAQDFIRSDGDRDIEDIGADYFDDLVAWSMFQEVKTNQDGKITCKIHDLLHDLAESIVKDEIYTFVEKSEQCPIASSNVRHSFLCFTSSTDGEFDKIQISATKLRTLFLHFHLDGIDKFNVDIFRQARFVRALVFSGVMVGPRNATMELPKVMDDMKHLRYLDLSRLDIVELPKSVSDLRKLHRLNLNNCNKLEKLPRGISGMVSLRYLEIEGTLSLQYLPKGLGGISCLRSLSKFIVEGGDEGEGCGMDELQPLNSLQGTLQIVHLERVSSREEAEKAKLWKKQHLGRLVLKMSGETVFDDYDHDDAKTGTIDSVLEGLRPHENLEELELHRFTGSKLPSWMDGMRCLKKMVLCGGPILERVPHLPSLKEFEIWKLRNEILPDEGWERLVALQILSIFHCKELKCVPEGLMQLPSLENLSISYCDKLESLPEGLGQLLSLENLQICWCNRLKSLPEGLGQLQKLKSLKVLGSRVLRCLPDSLGQLKKLKTLTVSALQVLRCLPDSVGQLESLEHLDIQFLGELESLPVSLSQLKKLKKLKICFMDVWTRLPDSVGQLASLESLLIHKCEKLECLPQGVHHLPHLPKLTINTCPVLWERYKREGGADWPNISHIPNVVIDHEVIQ